MKTDIKKVICACAAGTAAFSLITGSAMAKDYIYQYNKFVSTILGPQSGYCDFAASFAGHEAEYEDVNEYFSGLVSAFYEDIDADMDNELVTVDTRGVTVYQGDENGVVYLGHISRDLIANFGDSYANVFLVLGEGKKYIGIETYGKTVNDYALYLYDLDPETDELSKLLEIYREDNEDGIEERIWADKKTYYSYTKGGGIESSINNDGYEDAAAAADAALKDTVPDLGFETDYIKKRMYGEWTEDNSSFNAAGASLKTYVRAKGVRLSETPVVIFEDRSNLPELMVKPDLVSVVLDGQTLQFPTQDPVIVDGRTLVPMRTIFEALGAQVEWMDEDGVQSIIASTEETEINMTINSASFTVNGEEKELDVPAQLINDKTMVPIRAISESLGCYVGWDQDAMTVIIQSKLSE